MILKDNPLNTGERIRTFSGEYLSVFEPTPEEIHIEDIAHALSNQSRFAGQCKRHFSVAEHCIYISKFVPDHLKFEALMHDASEAYLVDMPSPIKSLFPQYKEIENLLMGVIAKKYNFSWPVHPLVKEADHIGLVYEWKNNVLTDNFKNDRPLTPKQAKKKFLELFEEYQKLR
jgi:5'-deoxynucleotidase YfbR-like HD superfamily hydrolase